MDKAFYKVVEVAEIIGLSRTKTYELVMKHEIESVLLAGSRSRRVPADALERWIDAQSAKAFQEPRLV